MDNLELFYDDAWLDPTERMRFSYIKDTETFMIHIGSAVPSVEHRAHIAGVRIYTYDKELLNYTYYTFCVINSSLMTKLMYDYAASEICAHCPIDLNEFKRCYFVWIDCPKK